MVAVRRLLGLSPEADREDIRAFFQGLYIPEGSVHIIGGRRGEAFIMFTSERDGQQAMERSGELLRGSSITLHVSSVSEMKLRFESRLRKTKSLAAEKKRAEVRKRKAKMEKKLENNQTADLGKVLLGLVAAIQGIQPNTPENQNQALPALPQSANQTSQAMDQTHHIDNLPESSAHLIKSHELESREPGYLRLYGLPGNVTKKKVCQFLEGLSVLDIIPNISLNQRQCWLVKVASLEEAEGGLAYNHRYLDDSCVEVRIAHKRTWLLYENGQSPTTLKVDRNSHDTHSFQMSPFKRSSEDRSLSGSPKRHHFDSVAAGAEHCVMVKNLFTKTTKTEIKEIFSCAHIPNDRIIHLLNKWGERTSTAFILFTDPEDYALAMNMDGKQNGSKTLAVSSITREKMRHLMYKERYKETERSVHDSQDCTALSCIYARNFPADVRKEAVKDFFCTYHISEHDITLLKDAKGNGIGEAVVEFSCEQYAKQACQLHGETFLGQQIILTCISPQQMKTILHQMY